MTHQLCRGDGVQSTALRPLADHGKAALHLHRVRQKLRRYFDILIAAKVWAKAPSFRLIQVSSGRSLVADKHTRAVTCGAAECAWLLRSVIGLPDRCYMIANNQFLDCNIA